MRSVDVSRENENNVFKTLYGVKEVKDNKVVFKYNIDDIVGISKVRGPFTKGYEQNYMHKFFKSERIPRTLPVYKLKDDDGEIIEELLKNLSR